MTEEVVVNARGEEISENGDDHSKIRAEHCNGVARAKDEAEEKENGNVGGGIEAVADSGDSDPIVTVDGNGAASEDHKVDGESQVTVTEDEGEWEVVNNNKENDCKNAVAVSNVSAEGACETTETVDVVEREGGESGTADGQNGSGSVAVSGDEEKDVITDNNTVAEGGEGFTSVQNGGSDREQSECHVENEIRDDVIITDDSVAEGGETVRDRELESVAVSGEEEVQNGVAEENEVGDDVIIADDSLAEGGETVGDRELESVAVGGEEVVQNGIAEEENEVCGEVDVRSKDVADVDKSGDPEQLEGAVVAVQNGAVVDRAEEIEIPVAVVKSVDCSDVQGRIEPVSDKGHGSVESEDVVNGDVSDEKHVGVTNGTHDDEVESVVVGEEVSECGLKKNEIPVDVDGVCAASEDAQNGLEEKVRVESVSDEGLVGAGVENGLAEMEVSECAEKNEIPVDRELERTGEGSGHEVVPDGENLSASNSADVIGDGDVVSEVNGNVAVESDGEPSVDTCEMKSNEVENEAEVPSNNAVKGDEGEPSVEVSETRNDDAAAVSEAEPSNNAEQSEGDPSVEVSEMRKNDAAAVNEAEPSNKAEQSEGDPSVEVSEMRNDDAAAANEAEPSNNVVESEGESSSNAVENEAEVPSNNAVKGKGEQLSVEVSEMRNDDVAAGSEAEPSNNAVESECERSNNALQSEGEPSSVEISEMRNDASGSEAEPSNNVVESEGEPSVDMPDLKTAVESEAEPSNNAVEREGGEPSNNATESEGECSNNAVQSEGEPSVDVPDLKTDAVESEAEPSNNAVQSEGEPSVDVPDLKTNGVESEAEPLVECEGSSNHADEESRPVTQEGSATDTSDGQNMVTEVVKKPFYYLIRFPRYDDDENIKDLIKMAIQQVEEKTRTRDTIRGESQAKKAICKEYGQEVRDAVSAERAARDLLKSKRQEIDLVQSTVNRLNNVISVGDIDDKIRNMEHMIQHETLPLKEEKQLIRQIKQLKQNRDELSTTMAKQDQSHQCLDNKDSIEEQFKQLQLLKKEMESLRNNVFKTEAVTKAARKKYDDECKQLSELLARFKAADDTRQEAYAKLQSLKKQLHEKSKYFWEYKNAVQKGLELAAQGKKEELQIFCTEQVERIMELWNNNDEFRRDYLRCNTRSTLRRLQTHDGRSLGPDEEPPVIPNALPDNRASKSSSVLQSTLEQEKKPMSTESVSIKAEPVSKVVVQGTERSQPTKAKKPAKPAPLEKSVVPVPRWGDESDEDSREEPVRTKEEEELILKAEKARKEEEAAKLKEMRRLEEIEKAKEALERKKRNAEKAQQRAAYKAQREAEQKEKEREKRARKKEKRKGASTTDAAADNAEPESAPISETLTEECDQSEKPVEVTKRSQKPSQFTRQTKVKPLPVSLRNRGKRRIQPWMWAIIAVLVVVALFYMGNNSFLRSSLQGFGF